jgi:NAD(P)-dependent dehydrogenase (short-subunit alcohol dehydrogenase family)
VRPCCCGSINATDLAGYGIRVNAIAPGAIQVESPADAAPQKDDVALVQRYGLPAEVAAAAAFLCSDEASYITGHVLPVDGYTGECLEYLSPRTRAMTAATAEEIDKCE